MPGISTGYWKAMNTPSQEASSGFISRRFFPSYRISPEVTSKLSRRASTCARVLFPDPFGPMIECTSPRFTTRSMPFRISCPPTLACRFLTSSKFICVPLFRGKLLFPSTAHLPDAAFQADTQQLLRFDGKFHGQFAEDFLTKSVHDHGNRVLCFQSTLAEVKQLVFTDLRCGGLV